MADQLEIIGGLLYRVMRILAEVGEASPDELWMRMRASDAGADPGWRRGSGDDPRSAVARKLVLRGAVYLARAGHLSESNRRWQATGIGRDALRASPDEAAWWRDVTEHNTYWREHRSSLGLVDDVLAVLPEQTWVSVTDLSTVADLTVDGLVRHLCGFRPEGWSRVLDPAGRPPREALFTEDEYRDWLDWFEVEVGDLTAGRAAGELRLPLDDLRMLVESIAPERIPRRAWLVRGADRRGRSLARDLWLADEVCSLPGDRLEVRPGVDREQVRRAVDREHASLTSARRGRLTSEYHAFLSRMRENDLVVVNDRDEYYVGEILGPPVFVASVGGVADLQRPVHWRNADEPVNYLDLPDRVAALLGNAEARIVDLSDFVADLDALVPAPAPVASIATTGAAPQSADADLAGQTLAGQALAGQALGGDDLREVTDEFADGLFYSRDWLRRCVELLRDRPQLIFYGPPGTGKTYLARRLAWHLADDRRENVTLVQFHPSYMYEDFFQGFRPVQVKGGDGDAATTNRMSFELVDGPLRRLATAAELNPRQAFFLIIDEINRGDLARIFGELYFLLEYRGEAVTTQYASADTRDFQLPKNLFIIGTMNSADRSIAAFDQALRRRFTFVGLHPDVEPTASVLRRWLAAGDLPDEAARLLGELNRRIDDPDARIGPSYLMRDRVHQSADGLDRVWEHQILPLLAEHHVGETIDLAARYGLPALRQSLGLAAVVPAAVVPAAGVPANTIPGPAAG
ncbi:McrB family protein [Frankia sp. CeD]|uniref:McrB family protein n=1 Tax=Frankia sp. CeD TaxID=258230 RepID=UPI0004DCC440|nr:AAA family ATPase [Frankia sp. CeD]KEZ36043.1 ATPase family protein associated with various cellular activities (AAA) [Frankia sp. CeD]